MTPDAEQRARELLTFCDGAEEAGLADYARRSRMVARDLLDALAELETERSARRSIQADRDRLLAQFAPGAHPS